MTNFLDQKSLRALEALCIQEEAPPCQAGCPVHVDVRTMLGKLAAGDAAGASQVLQKSVPFPGIISRVCDEPCRLPCTRGKIGDPIAIRALERAALEMSGDRREPVKTLPARNKQVAIVGGGLSGLTAAFDLVRKGYHVAVFERTGRLGGRIWDTPDDVLPEEVISADLAILDSLPGLDVYYDHAVDDLFGIEELNVTFDAIYLAVGAEWGGLDELLVDADGRLSVNSVTYETARPCVFAGGSLLRPGEAWSPITSISDGRRAAISIDRYIQKVSLTASREREGAYPSKLYTSTVGIPPEPVTPMRDPEAGYSPDEAIAEAARCIQCECLECVKVCAYLDKYGGYPKNHARTIYNNLSIVMGERYANTFINSCALCGLCMEVCPNDFDMGSLCQQAREVMVQQGRMPPSTHDFALRDMAFSLSDKFALARHQPGTTASTYLVFPGGQLAGSRPGAVEEVYTYLQSVLSGGVGLMLGCCGAPAEWAGRKELFGEVLASFEAQHAEMGRPTLVLACPSCQQVFSKHLPDVEIISLWELFAREGLPADAARLEAGYTVSVHDPCTARYETAVQDSVRQIIERLGGAIEELPLSRERTTCCSYGGLMVFADRELARETVARRVAESPADYVTYCAICRDFFAAQGKPTLHLLDLIFGADDSAAGRGPTWSERHENRARLKRKLLTELWGEAMTDGEAYEAIKLNISEDVAALLDERLILVEDIQQVIAYAERTDHKLLNSDTGHYLAHYRPAAVTYWVEYAPEGDVFTVYNAYSHRMEVDEDRKS